MRPLTTQLMKEGRKPDPRAYRHREEEVACEGGDDRDSGFELEDGSGEVPMTGRIAERGTGRDEPWNSRGDRLIGAVRPDLFDDESITLEENETINPVVTAEPGERGVQFRHEWHRRHG